MNLTCLGRYGPYPAPLGRTSSYLLRTDETAVVLDFGTGALSQLLDFCAVKQVDAVIISHLHADHISDMRVLAYMLNPLVKSGAVAKLPVYLPDEPQAAYEEIARQPAFLANVINPGQPLVIGDIDISFQRTVHPVLCYAMRLKTPTGSLVYTADSSFDPALADFAKDADALLCDAAFSNENRPQGAPHMCGEEAAKLANLAQAGALWLTHLNPETDENALLTQARAVFANTWMVIEHETFEVGI